MEPVAIIGTSFRLPQDVDDISGLWSMLENGRNVMSEWPESRANLDAFYDASTSARNRVKARGAHFLTESPGAFDAPFFSITSKEAASMDPQQRWLLETSYRAFENAGIPIDKVAGTNTAVFAGSMADDYTKIIAKDPDHTPANIATGTSVSILANRISWYFNLKGPSIQLNTACSTSMIAMDLACQSLRNGQSSMALVTGSNVILSVENSIYLSQMNFLSPDSLSYSFDHRANGYARGEGVIVMVLKRLSDAVRDGDMIRAVIRGTGSNQDGRTPGLTQPSASAQEQLVRSVYKSCNLGLGSTRYIEAHGTGTQLGDSGELAALGRVFRTSRSPEQPLYVGSLKANIGHLEGGAGLAGVLKCIAILEKGIIPPNPLFEKMNPKVNAKYYNLQVPLRNIPWPASGVRRVSINSFGFGGSNGHMIMDDAYHTLQEHSMKGLHCTQALTVVTQSHENGILPDKSLELLAAIDCKQPSAENYPACRSESITSNVPSSISKEINHRWSSCDQHEVTRNNGSVDSATKQWSATALATANMSAEKHQLLVWSARDEAALARMIEQHSNYYKEHRLSSPAFVERYSFTLATRRTQMTWRAFAVVGPHPEESSVDTTSTSISRSSKHRELAFVFTGQGAQYSGMGLSLLQYMAFRDSLDRASKVYRTLGVSWSLTEVLQGHENINSPELSQPLCTAVQLALVDLFRSFEVMPAIVVGHSSGEIAAAYAAGSICFESACKVAFHRGRLSKQLSSTADRPSAMLSVNLSESEAETYLKNSTSATELSIACINSPSNVTISGDEASIDAVKADLDQLEIYAQKVRTGIAYHSPLMQSIAEEYLSSMGTLRLGVPASEDVVMISSVTGQPITSMIACQSQYWVENLVSPVRFADALHYMATVLPMTDNKHISDYLELGPHGALRRPICDTLNQVSDSNAYNYMSALSKFESPSKTVLETAGRLFSRGYPIAITSVNQQNAQSEGRPFLVDLPGYPFDHSQVYWYESRLSSQWRKREAVSSSLLGIPTTDYTPLEPRWRKMLSVEQVPWVADHVVGETLFFPGTGSLTMALEAVAEVSSSQKTISAYQIKEATFLKPIVVRSEENTEVITTLRPLQHSYEKTSTRFEVHITALLDDCWNECFHAIIHVQYEEVSVEVDAGKEARAEAATFLRNHQMAAAACTQEINSTDFYQWHHTQGLKYGDAFALADQICWDGQELGLARVNVEAITDQFKGIVHPAVLDAACQVCFVAPSNGLTAALPTIIPHKLHNVWISASGWQYPHTRSIRMLTASKFKATVKGLDCSFTALADDNTPLCFVQHLEMLPIVGLQATNHNGRKLLYTIDWKPDLALMSPKQLSLYCGVEDFARDECEIVTLRSRLERALRASLDHNAPALGTLDLSQAPPYMVKYANWLRKQMGTTIRSCEDQSSEKRLQEELDDLRTLMPRWDLFVQVARNLQSILLGEVDPLELFFTGSLAQDTYVDHFDCLFDERLKSFLDLCAHRNPQQRILEVGAGTGSVTRRLLSAFQAIERRTGGIAFAHYTYSDITRAFFDQAQQQFSDYGDRMVYKIVDLDRDLAAQGIESGSYDMILAGNVLHATKSLSFTLDNARRALKPDGHLVFHETTAPDCFITGFGFGSLPGWWAATEDFRSECPTVTTTEWDTLLRNSGFSGNDLVIRDYQDDAAHYGDIIISTALKQPHDAMNGTAYTILVADNDTYQQEIAATLAQEAFDASFPRPRIVALADVVVSDISEIDHVIFFANMQDWSLENITECDFSLIQLCIQHTKSLVWVTLSYPSDDRSPALALKDGLLRSLRSEFSAKRLISVSIEGDRDHLAGHVNSISQVLRSVFQDSSPEVEFKIQNQHFLTGRLVEDVNANNDVNSFTTPQVQKGPWLEEGTPLKLDIGSRGSLETLQFVKDEAHSRSLGPHEVEIEAKAWGVNFRDMFSALGRLTEEGFGSDCAGIVTRVGSQCMTLQPGDRACMCVIDCMRAYPRSDESAVAKIPDSVTFEEACAVINPALTAYHCLIEVARLQKGDKILIHAASGSTGQLAVQLSQMVGAEVFATVGKYPKAGMHAFFVGRPKNYLIHMTQGVNLSPIMDTTQCANQVSDVKYIINMLTYFIPPGYDHKKALLMESYHIPEDHIFYSRDLSFAKGVMRMTGGVGVDVVLNSLVGEGLRASWECIAPYGRFVEIGKADINANTSLPMASFAKNASFTAVDLRHMGVHRKAAASKLLRTAIDLTRDASIHHPEPLHIYDVCNVEDAFRFFQSGKNTGRIVVKIDPYVEVEKHLKYDSTWKFHSDSTYIIAGGLGGIGRSIIRWLAAKGAKHIIVLSRSACTSSQAAMVMDELTKMGIDVVAPSCDVSSSQEVKQVLEHCSKTMPPVQGCINAAMVLNDSIFENMTHAQWTATVKSKADTSWNLHDILPQDLDFFIMLSSVSGVLGNISQSNYAAGCTYQDSLASYRVQRGQRALSLNLGVVRDVGIVAESADLQKKFNNAFKQTQVEAKDLLAVLDIVCSPAHGSSYRDRHQIVIGITTPADLLADGVEVDEMLRRPLFAHFSQTRNMSPTLLEGNKVNAAQLFRQSLSAEERSMIVVRSLATKLARALSIQPDDIDVDQPLHVFGVDSLVAVELKNWLSKEFGADVPVFEIMGGKSVSVIGKLVSQTSHIGKGRGTS